MSVAGRRPLGSGVNKSVQWGYVVRLPILHVPFTGRKLK
jgi:hypothetical protein